MATTEHEELNRVTKAAKLASWLIANGDDADIVSSLDDAEWEEAATEAGVRTPSPATRLVVISLVRFFHAGEAKGLEFGAVLA